ncbi:glycosyltransferase family 4 protein [Spiribacter pallidus]|uniref:Glycosyltransferase family 4 protein n=1 Tax=Spiribacter pallidus TaxID=1987936 RepID=A0ABV3TEQ1_9GAMM
MNESAEAFKPAVLHINLARGWRGGEQQTWLLMKELSAAGYRQGLCGYANAPLAERVKILDNVTVVTPRRCSLWPWSVDQWSVAHAHEGRGVYLAWWLKKTLGLPYLVTRRMQHPPKPRLLTKAVYRDADALVGISSAACRALESFVPNRHVHCIPSVHSGEKASPAASAAIRQLYAKGPESILVGHAGALVDSHKGQTLLIKACEALRSDGFKITCLLLGDGRDRPVLEKMARGRDWVHLPGYVHDIQDHLSSLDVFAFPSRHEGLGSVLLEAMAAGCPVVATEVGGIPDIIQHQTTGLLVPPNDVVKLAEALRFLVSEPKKRTALSKNASKDVRDNFSVKKMFLLYQKRYTLISGS